MPIGIGVEGGVNRTEALRNIRNVDSEKALGTLEQIRTQLSQPGRDSGVLTLHNRTNSGTEMTLERKNSFQMLFQDKKRLDDTVIAMRSLLFSAGQHKAVEALDHYLLFGGGDRNKIESSKMLEILNQHLPPGGQDGDQKLVESGKVSEIVDPPVPPPDGQDGDQNRLEPGKMLETLRPVLPPPGSTKDEVYKSSGLVKLQELKSGAFGRTFLIKLGGEELVLKEAKQAEPLDLDRSKTARNNESVGSYLSSSKHPNYLTKTVNITQPTSFLISVKNGDQDEFRLLDGHTLRRFLVLEAKKDPPSTVMSHGLVMPKAGGERVSKLFKQGLSEPQQKDFCRSTLSSIKGLNERGFVHRDLKPKNAFFDRDNGTTTLIDTGTLFKESKHTDRKDRSQYIQDGGFGTGKYMHPRAHNGEKHGTETDLYAFAVMTMEMAHPKGWTDFIALSRDDVPPKGRSNGREWLGKTLDKTIETVKSQEAKANPGKDRTELQEKRERLEALRRDMDDPNTPTHFAVECFEKTRVSSEDWHDRTQAQAMYSELQKHPFLKQQQV